MGICRFRSYLTFILIFLLVNIFVYLILVPTPSNYEVMWKYYDKHPRIDTIFIGTSIANCALDPTYYDTASGETSYNMASNNQSLETGFLCIKEAYKERQIRRAVWVIDDDVLTWDYDQTYADISKYTEALIRHNLTDGLSCFIDRIKDQSLIKKTESFKSIIPWIYGKSFNLISYRIKCLLGMISDPDLNMMWHRDENGFSHSTEKFSGSIPQPESETMKVFINESSSRLLSDMLRYCSENNIELDAIVMPGQNTNTNYDELKNIVIRGNGSFYDFSSGGEYGLSISSEMYRDGSHFNDEGAAVFSSFLGNTLIRKEVD